MGDTAVAVNPDDERYKDIVGKTLILPLVGREIPVVADAYVEKDFGTGVVKITPAHDPNDFEVGVRHNLPRINVMNDDGTMNEKAGKYAGMDRMEARKAVFKSFRLAKKSKNTQSMARKKTADGKREENSVTPPSIAEKRAMHQ